MSWGFPILLASGLAVGWAMLVLFTAYILTHPPRRGYAFAVSRGIPGDPSELTVHSPDGQSRRGLPYEQWTFRSRGIDLPVWDVRGLNPSGPTVVVTHGWGDSRVVMLSRLAHLAAMASRIVLWDLPGHGDAPGGSGRFTLGLREGDDLAALVERLGSTNGTRSRCASSHAPIVLFGASLGAGASIVAAVKLGSRRDAPHIAGVIAEAPYRLPITPARNVFRLRGMPYRSNTMPALALLGLRFGQGLAWAISRDAGGFDRVEFSRRLSPSVPLLVLHGSEDPICPLDDGRAIAESVPGGSGRYVVIPGGGHNNLWTDSMHAPLSAAAVRELLQPLSVAHDPKPEPAGPIAPEKR